VVAEPAKVGRPPHGLVDMVGGQLLPRSPLTWLATQVATGTLDPQISWRGGWA